MAQPQRDFSEAGADKGVSAGADNQTLSAFIFKSADDVRKILHTKTSDVAGDAKTMKEFDVLGAPQISDDNKITKLPVDFSGIPQARRKELEEKASGLIDKYMGGTKPDGGKDEELSFGDVGNIMKDIAKMKDLTEVEKCRLWSDVHQKMQRDDITVTDKDEYSSMIDSWKGSSDPWHAIISMNDGYHADRLINMSKEDATKAILEHENGGETDQMGFFRGLLWKGAKAVYGVNQGDINASEGQLSALRELRSKGTFSAYADEWNYQFVRKDVDQYGRPVE